MTWDSDVPPDAPRLGGIRRFGAGLKGVLLGVWVFGLLGLHMLVRLIERPLFRTRRPITPWITVAVCRGALAILGIARRESGAPLVPRGAVVANHSSWLDIFVLNAMGPLYFVSKAEVAGWPGIGLLARATGTVFIERDRREARAQADLFERRMHAGHRLLFFPEGTSTDGRHVLPFKTTLFQSFLADGLRDELQVQPVTVVYRAPPGEDARFYGWWGGMDFAPHLVKVLARGRGGAVEVIRHAPVTVADHTGRKSLARACEAPVHESFARRLSSSGR